MRFIHNQSLLSHGQGPLYSIKLGPYWGRGLKISFGGYDLSDSGRRFVRFISYCSIAHHLVVGRLCITWIVK